MADRMTVKIDAQINIFLIILIKYLFNNNSRKTSVLSEDTLVDIVGLIGQGQR